MKNDENICNRQYIVSSSSLIQQSSCFPLHFGISPSNSFSPRASAQTSSFQSQIARRILPQLKLAKNVQNSTRMADCRAKLNYSDYRFASLSTSWDDCWSQDASRLSCQRQGFGQKCVVVIAHLASCGEPFAATGSKWPRDLLLHHPPE